VKWGLSKFTSLSRQQKSQDRKEKQKPTDTMNAALKRMEKGFFLSCILRLCPQSILMIK